MANTKIPVELSSTPSIVDGGNATAITIDSSENVLVGQTLASSNAVGTSLRQDGRNFYCADGNYSAHFNRKTSDGAIVHFAKDDTIVGSIGVDFNTEFYMGGGGGGFYINTASIRPTTGGDASTLSDNTHDLGASSTRFKDIYLSGGVNFGATGGAVSSKTLDDYEEGTWTVTDQSGASMSLTVYVATYTKIGNQVFFEIGMVFPATSSTATILLSLPFTAKNSGDNTGGACISDTNSGRTDNFLVLRNSATFAVNTNGIAAVTNANYSTKNLKLNGQYTAA
jgi:hypothetical protein